MKRIFVLAALLGLFLPSQSGAQVFNRDPLLGGDLALLPIGAIKPEGWLKDQLQRQANGMTGHLDELYPEVVGSNNAWLGGDGDTWERGPYWIDGLLPLAYILEDEELIRKAIRWTEAIITSATEEGYFGNSVDHEYMAGLQRDKSRDWWPKMVALKILQQYYEATGDARVPAVLDGYFRYQLKTLKEKPLGYWSFWAEWRAADNLNVLYWLYNQSGEAYLLELAELIHSQTIDFTGMFWDGQVFRQQNSAHCVNLAQGFKTPMVWWQQSHDEKDRQAPAQALATIRGSIGFPTGLWAGDELLHYGNPVRGSELCTAVEMMYSLEEMLRISGDPSWADRLEQVAFNALPTQVTDDYDAHQYFQQVNQIACTRERHNFVTDHHGTDLVFGLLNGYPCCACNMHQGWPKFTRNLWYATRDGGLAALVYAPNTLRTTVNGMPVTVREETFYPFDSQVVFTLELPRRKDRVNFPLQLRIPAWCQGAEVRVNGQEVAVPEDGTLVLDREWKSGDRVELTLPMDIRTSQWYDDATVVERGPLLYALRLEENWVRKEFEGAEKTKYGPFYYEVTTGDAWNYGMRSEKLHIRVAETHPYDGSYPWNVENAPVVLEVDAVVLPDWKAYNGSAGPITYYNEMADDLGEAATIRLIPYGCTTLRIAEFPTR